MNVFPHKPIPFSILCGEAAITHAIITYLEKLGFRYDPGAELVILFQGNLDHDLSKALDGISNGKYYWNTDIATRLTFAERKILSYVARGYDDKEIAGQLTLKPQSVSNTLSRVLGKLELKNRTQAALYYWGIWQFLEQIHNQDWVR